MPDVGKQPTDNAPHFIKYPPFPVCPEGVTIIPFKDFKECGIPAFNEDPEVELDGMGIPTAVLKKRYEEDVCKTNAKRRPAIIFNRLKPSAAFRREWWEQWEEGEHLRVTSGYLGGSLVDDLVQAADDFKTGRTWPTHLGIEYLWDQFRRYVGLPNVPVPQKTNQPGPGDREADDADDSDNDIDDPTASASASIFVERSGGPGESLPQTLNEEGTPDESDEVVSKTKEDRLLFFLSDPEHAIKIFLSSYMRTEGLIWSNRNLTIIPRLLSFFINFLLRSRVFPEPNKFQRSLAIVNQANMELPLTSRIAKVLPDDFSEACKECWGRKVHMHRSPSPQTQPEENEEPELDTDQTEELVKEFEDALKDSSVQVLDDVLSEDGTTTPIADEESSDLGAEDRNSWHDWRNSDSLGNKATEAANWGVPQPHFLMTLLGPTIFPVTHTTGIVERAVRRVKTIIPPPGTTNKLPDMGGEILGPDADSVEFELERRFTKVVMEPWTDWDVTDESMPKILEGLVAEDDEAAPSLADAGLKAHNPYKDDITMLIEPSTAEALCLGMGLGGTWVQLVRSCDIDDSDTYTGGREEACGKAVQRFWYLEELMMTLPSYYTAGEF